MSVLKTNAVQIGQSLTPTNNFVWYQPEVPDGTIRLANGNSGSTTDILTINSIGNATFVGSVTAYGTTTSAADLKLYEDTDNGNNYVALKAPASIASNITWTLPSADGSNGYALKTDGSGTLSWGSVLPTQTDNSGKFLSTDGSSSSWTSLGSTATTFTATQTFTGSTSAIAAVLTNSAEKVTVSATAATGTVAIYPSSQSILYYTTNASGNWTTNLTFSAGTTLNSAMTIGQAITVAFLATQGGTAYYNTTVQVDGTTSGVTTKWQTGTAPTSGNASAIDAYTYTIIKTADATFTVLASQTKFA